MQTTSSDVRHRQLRRIVATMAILVSLAAGPGCARTRPVVNSIWQQVPPVRWPSREVTSHVRPADSASEPTVAANVALNDQKKPESPVAATAVPPKPKGPVSPFGVRATPQESQIGDDAEFQEFHDSLESTANASNDPDNASSPLDRLDAALNDDVRHAAALPQRSVTMLEERLRVDSLIVRAKDLIDAGQLERAREAAVLALEIGDTAELEFSPDEERPVDLVRQIERHIEASRHSQPLEKEPEATASESNVNESDPTSAVEKPVDPQEKDAKVTSRLQRGWSTLFRREKKSAAAVPTDPVRQPAHELDKRAADASLGPPISLNHQPQHQPIAHDAIVMANRSVSLETPELESESDQLIPAAREVRESEVLDDATDSKVEVEASEIEDDQESTDIIKQIPTIATVDTSERSISLPDVESVDVSPDDLNREPELDELQPDNDAAPESAQGSGWNYLYVTMGLCCLLAFVGYRRA
jgi:hypothetical protein